MMRKNQKKRKAEAEASKQKAGGRTAPAASIAGWLQKVKFKRSLIGGLREEDVWTKISELNALYEKALEAERIRCDVLIEHYRQEAVTSAQDSKSEKRPETETKAASKKEHSAIVLMGKRQ